MSYCEIGQIATVNYSFANAAQKYVTSRSPIDVSVTPDYPDGQCLGLPYRVRFWFTGTYGRYGDYGWITDINRSFIKPLLTNPIYGSIYRIEVAQASNRFFLKVLCHGHASVNRQVGGCWVLDPFYSSPVWAEPYSIYGGSNPDVTGYEIVEIIPDTITAQGYNLCTKYDYTRNCGKLVKLEVKKDGLIIFSDRGNEPCNFTVSCGREKCPPGTVCECDCGDVICCYGSSGLVLKTVPK